MYAKSSRAADIRQKMVVVYFEIQAADFLR